jgi:adenylylsulfate kinase-like enzyme
MAAMSSGGDSSYGRRARAGEIPAFTGISDPYKASENPSLHLHTDVMDKDSAVDQVLALISDHYLRSES